MREKDTGGPAFPRPFGYYPVNGAKFSPSQDGMTLRDWFAGMAMQGLVAQSEGTAINSSTAIGAEYAYRMADAMIIERNKPT